MTITDSKTARKLLQAQLDSELAAVAWAADYDGATGSGAQDTHTAALEVARDVAGCEIGDRMWADIIIASYLTARPAHTTTTDETFMTDPRIVELIYAIGRYLSDAGWNITDELDDDMVTVEDPRSAAFADGHITIKIEAM